MTEIQIVEYFRNLAIRLKDISHKEVDGKKRFASSFLEAQEGLASKLDSKEFFLVVDFSHGKYEQNMAEAQFKYTPATISILKICDNNDFEGQLYTKAYACIIWEKLLLKMYKDRDMDIIRFDRVMPYEYMNGEIVDPNCFGIAVEVSFQRSIYNSYNEEDWNEEVLANLDGTPILNLDGDFITA